MSREMLADRIDGDARRLRGRIAVDAGRDRREGDAFEHPFGGDLQRIPVAARKKLRLARAAAVPDRADAMKDEARRKPITAGKPAFAGRTAADRPALLGKAGSGGPEDRAAYAAALRQRIVRGIGDGCHLEPGDIAHKKLDPVGCHISLDMLASFHIGNESRTGRSRRRPSAITPEGSHAELLA
jgi:hypothetical protein